MSLLQGLEECSTAVEQWQVASIAEASSRLVEEKTH